MSHRTRILLWIVALGVADAVIPGLPVLGLILLYVVVYRPAWFVDMARHVYEDED